MVDLKALEQAVAVSPENVPLNILLANAYLEAFSLEDARERFEHVLALDPTNAAAKTGIAQILDLNGKTSEAIIRLEQLCTESPGHAPAWILRAKLALSENSTDEARDYYDRAIAADQSAADAELLKRIVEAGGESNSTHQSRRERVTPIFSGDASAGAFLETDDDDEGDDDFSFADDETMAEIGLEFLAKADVDFAQVGGMEQVKENIRMKILYPMQNKELFEAYGKKAGGGVLLYGPPGCGKTLISRATAGEIKANFMSVGLHQILDMWIGSSEKRLHEIFEFARRNAPAVLFFDEVDALAADRKDMKMSGSRHLINQFLAELDGNIDTNDGVLILGATNAPWHLDSAFLRPGRFDRLVFVPPPDEGARAEIVKIMAEGKPVSGLNPEDLAKRLKDFSGADIQAVFDQAVEAALDEAMKSGKIVPVSGKQLAKTAKQIKPSTRRWFESAKNYALYANQSGFYDDVLEYLGVKK